MQLQKGSLAPLFTLKDHDGKAVSLQDFKGRKVLVYFYPKADTPGCTKQACDFRDNRAVLQGQGYAVVGISPDSPAKLAKFTDKESLTFPVLADEDKAVMNAYGAYGEKKLYGKTVTGVIRSTIVVGEDGTVELAKYNVKATGHVAMLAKALGLSLS